MDQVQEVTTPRLSVEPRIKKTERVLGIEAHSYAALAAADLGVKLTATDMASFETMTVAQINKTLFAMSRTQAAERRSTLTNAQIGELALLGRSRIGDMKRQLESQRVDAISRLQHLYTNALKYHETLAVVSNSLRSLEVSGGIDLAEQVRTVLADGWYELGEVDSTRVDFITSPVTLRYDEINKEVQMGRYLVRVKPAIGKIQILMHADNLRTPNGYYHPHISSSNDVCWGNAHAAYTKLASDMDMVPAMTAIRALLQTYNPDSPYATFNRFESLYHIKQRGLHGDAILTEPVTGCARLRYPYDGAIKPIRHAKRLLATPTRWYVECGFGDGFAAMTLNDGSYITAAVDAPNNFNPRFGDYWHCSDQGETATIEGIIHYYAHSTIYEVDVASLANMTDAEIRSMLSGPVRPDRTDCTITLITKTEENDNE